MNRLDRLAAILIQLQSKKIVKAQEVADRFEISLRTVYRDVRALQEAGIPIGVEPGRGYFIIDGYFLPPVMFTKEEASAMLIGGKLIEKMSDESVTKEFSSALYKIKSVLKTTDKEYLDKLESTIGVRNRLEHIYNSNKFFLSIQKAVVENIELELEYYSLHSDETNKRNVKPIGLSHYSNAWHLIAYCNKRNDYRDFRIDRIKLLKLSNQKFDSSKYYSLQEYFEKSKSKYDLYESVIRIDNSIKRFVDQYKYYFLFQSEKEVNGKTEMVFLTDGSNYFANWILSLGRDIEVVKPEKLKVKIKSILNDLYNYYEKI